MTIKFKQDLEDLYSYNYYHAWASPERKNYRLKSYLLLPLIGVAFVIYKTLGVQPDIRLAYATNLGFGIGVVIIIYWFTLKSLVARRIQKTLDRTLKNSKNEELLGNKEIEIDEKGLIAKGDHSHSELSWNSIEKFRETEDYYFLFLNGLSALVIPKDSVSNKEDFEALLTSNINPE